MRFIGFLQLFDTLGEADPRRPELLAGFLIMRIADDVLRRGSAYEGAREGARKHVILIGDFDTQEQLKHILEETGPSACAQRRPTMIRRLMAYGVTLHAKGLLAAAADVFGLLSERVCEDIDLRLQAMLSRAFALRVMAQFDDADAAYLELMVLAATEGDRRKQLEAELGMARVLLDRGNVPAGEAMVISVATTAKNAGDVSLMANASIDLARIAGLRGCPQESLSHSHAALLHTTWGESRSRILTNMATALRELGRADVAAQVARHVAARAGSVDQRAMATLVLYNLAIDARDAAMARHHRSDLAMARLTPVIAAEYYETEGREHAIFGRWNAAAASIRRMLAVSEDAKLHELTVRADRALADVSLLIVPRVYEFQPTLVLAPPPGRHSVEEIESDLLELCAS